MPDAACVLLTLTGRDDDFLRHGALVTLRSLRATNLQIPVVILFDNLNAEQRRLLAGYDLRRFDVGGFRRSVISTEHRPDLDNSIFLRFGVEDLLDFDTVLYLDCDVVVLDTLDPILAMQGEIVGRPMHDKPLATQFRQGKRVLAEERLSADLRAVNAGVLKFNVRYWREAGLRDQVMRLADKHGWDSFTFCDQSLINLVGYRTGTLHHMPTLYNFSLWPDMREGKHFVGENAGGLAAPITEEGVVKVVHWTGPIKPWQSSFRQLSRHEQELYCIQCYQQFAE